MITQDNTVTVSQTLAGGWVVTIPNAVEEGWETELMSTDQDNPTIRRSVALFAMNVARDIGFLVHVTSHDSDVRSVMVDIASRVAHDLRMTNNLG